MANQIDIDTELKLATDFERGFAPDFECDRVALLSL
jgi:hypothetical protein